MIGTSVRTRGHATSHEGSTNIGVTNYLTQISFHCVFLLLRKVCFRFLPYLFLSRFSNCFSLFSGFLVSFIQWSYYFTRHRVEKRPFSLWGYFQYRQHIHHVYVYILSYMFFFMILQGVLGEHCKPGDAIAWFCHFYMRWRPLVPPFIFWGTWFFSLLL